MTEEVGAREAKKKTLCKSGSSTAFTFVQIFKVKLNNQSFHNEFFCCHRF